MGFFVCWTARSLEPSTNLLRGADDVRTYFMGIKEYFEIPGDFSII